MKQLKALIAFFTLFGAVKAQTVYNYGNCDYKGTIASVGQSVTANHLPSYGTCRYQIVGPPDTIVRATCSLTLNGNCNTQKVWFSRSGEKDLKDGQYYCTSGSVNIQSIGNELVVVFYSSVANSGQFNCKFESVAITDANCDCGWIGKPKIVGGVQTGINEYVSQAGLVDTASKEIYCGATIVSQKWAVSAAHCFDAFPNVDNSLLLVGEHDTRTGTETPWAAAYYIQRYIKHSQYNSDGNINDIAMINTRDYIRFNLGVGPACMPYTFNGYNFDGKSLTAVGFGTTSFGGSSSPVLLKASLGVMSNSVCTSKMIDVGPIDSTKICTYGDKVRDTCGKDSGGGLYWFANRNYFIAVVNYGVYCASAYPSVNTRVTSYFGFIESYTGRLCNRK